MSEQATDDAELEGAVLASDEDDTAPSGDEGDAAGGDTDAAGDSEGRFPDKETAELSYRELQSHSSRVERELREQIKQLEERFNQASDEPQDPMAFLPPSVDEALLERVNAEAVRDPAKTALWAMQNPEVLGPEYTQQLVDHWARERPSQFNVWLLEQHQQQIQSQFDERIAPLTQREAEQTLNNAISELKAGIPDYDTYKDQLGKRIAEMPDEIIVDPQLASAWLLDEYFKLKGREQYAATKQAGPTGAVEPAKQRARGETRSNAPTPSPDQDQAIRDWALGRSA